MTEKLQSSQADAADVAREQAIPRGRFTGFEHTRSVYVADFVVYGSAAVVLAVTLAVDGSRGAWPQRLAQVASGLLAWTLIEYLVHRYVLHGLQPFSRWHAEHHRRPMALIGTPTVVSASLLAGLVFLPAWLLWGPWPARALLLGVTLGYFWYSMAHHALHHWRADVPWLLRRKRWHARHHHGGSVGYYGVTSGIWDRVFRTASDDPRHSRDAA